MSNVMPVMARWVKTKIRCHYCNRPVENAYVVTDPPIMGKFCGRNCYQLAREAYENEQANQKV